MSDAKRLKALQDENAKLKKLDILSTRYFQRERSGSRGFAAPEDNLAVCLLPGTELSFADEVRRESSWP